MIEWRRKGGGYFGTIRGAEKGFCEISARKYCEFGVSRKEGSGGEVQGVLCKPGENFKRRLAGLCAGLYRRKRGRGRITPGFCRPSEGAEAAVVGVLTLSAPGDSAAPGEDLRGCFRLLPEKFRKTGAANPLKNERVGIGTGNPVNFDRVDDEGRGVTELMTPRRDRCQSTLTKRTS